MPVSVERQFIRTSADIALEVYQFAGGNKLALLLHGFPEHASCWEAQIQLLLDHGYTVWAPNLRGYGNSSRPADVRRYAVSEMMSDIAALIDAGNKDEVLLIGHDVGAMLCWHFVLQNVRPVSAMIVLGSFHPAMSTRLMSGSQALRSWYIGLFIVPRVPEYLFTLLETSGMMQLLHRAARKDSFYKKIICMYRVQMRTPGRVSAMLNHYRASLNPSLWPPAARDAISRHISTPVLIINGKQDPWISRQMLDGTEHLVRNLSIRLVPDAGHWVHMRSPSVVNRQIADWLDGLLTGESRDLTG